MGIEAKIRQKALDLGFDRVGITTAEPLEASYADYHQRWLDAGCAAQMGYMHRNNDKRFSPAKLLDGAQSVICVALNYRPDPQEMAEAAQPMICRYALYDDYHGFIKSRLNALAASIQALAAAQSPKFKACCDSIPLAERALAHRAGLGFIGRNHLLIHPDLGCQIWLGELLTTLPLKPDAPLEGDFCGKCRKCIAACPTGALGDEGAFDARLCLSYQTMQPKGVSDELPAAKTARPLFGCDACMTACPYETNAPPRANPDLRIHAERLTLTPDRVLGWTQADFDAAFKGSCLERIGLAQLCSNARCALESLA